MRAACRKVLGLFFCASAICAASAVAQDRGFRLAVPSELIASGLIEHIVPRFSLKTNTRVEIVNESGGNVANFNARGKGRAVFEGLGKRWHFNPGSAQAAVRFETWLTGEVGRRTIEEYERDGNRAFTAARGGGSDGEAPTFAGDVAAGEALSQRHCGRCHMVNEKTRMTTIGSTPSFALLRSFPDWDSRFEAFFSLNPHPSFTIVTGVTEPFDASRPPAIIPVEVTLQDIEAILAYVASIPPADLGSPLKLQ